MTDHSADSQLRKTARTAGLWYLATVITDVFCLLYLPKKIMVTGNADATASNIIANEMLYRIGILVSLISQVTFVVTALYLYRLFKEVNLRYARLMVALVLASVPVAFVSILNSVAPLVLLSGAEYLSAFSTSQLHAAAMFFLDLDQQFTFTGELFWGLWLFPFGLLVIKSRFIPRILGILLIINGFSYLVLSCASLLIPAHLDTVQTITMAPMMIGELSIVLWLLIVGVKSKTVQ